jgi:type I restriction enzyme R subunit
MSSPLGEKYLEDAIEAELVGSVAPAEPGGELVETPEPYGGPLRYRRRHSSGYDKALCLIPDDVIDFVLSTQPKAWQRLGELHGEDVRKHFLRRLASEIDKRGTLEVLRQGIKDSGVAVRLAYFKPHSGLNEDLQRLYEANLFTLVRQLYYSEREPPGEKQQSLDLVLFLNGLPLFTAELKNPLTGQD